MNRSPRHSSADGAPGCSPCRSIIDAGSVGAYFESLEDPRHTRQRNPLLIDIVVVAARGITGDCDGPTAIHRCSTLQEEWLKKRLTLPNGLPSRDCLRRLLMRLKPEVFQDCFRQWTAGAFPPDPEGNRRLATIDGKTRRRSHDTSHGLGMPRLVSALHRKHPKKDSLRRKMIRCGVSAA